MPSKSVKKWNRLNWMKHVQFEWYLWNVDFSSWCLRDINISNDCLKFHYSPIKLKFDKQGLLFVWFKILLFCYNFEFLFCKYDVPTKPPNKNLVDLGKCMSLIKDPKNPSTYFNWKT